MSRYPPPDYRGRDRSRSPPPHFSDRRASAASIFDNRPSGPARSASDAPRGPRSQYDGARPPQPSGPPIGGPPRPAYPSLRDAPPLGTGDRGRSYRERDYERRDRPPSPRDRSPPRFPPRDLDIARQRRDSRDGLPIGSSYPESQPISAGTFRGGFPPGRGRGDFPPRGGRGGRSVFGERELIRPSDRSPSREWGRDLSRDSRDADPRRDDRRFDRREDERRPAEWPERDRDFDRPRREPLPAPPRLEGRNSNDSMGSANTAFQTSGVPRINPERLALIEGAGADNSVRRPPMQQEAPPLREAKREAPETSAFFNARAATTANRYGTRGSSSPQQAPPVPAFTLSFAPSTTSAAPPVQPRQPSQTTKPTQDLKRTNSRPSSSGTELPNKTNDLPRPAPPADAPIAPRVPPPAPKALLANPPPAAPRGPRVQDADDAATSNRLHPTRSLENLPSHSSYQIHPPKAGPTGTSVSSTGPSALPSLNQPVTPHPSQNARFGDLGPPTGPRAARVSPAQVSISPRPPFASPKSDFSAPSGPSSLPRTTPPVTAPVGPRSRPFSTSPKAVAPTAPRGLQRVPPLAPRGPERGPQSTSRASDRLAAAPPWAAPSAPRSLQWNQWKRPGVPGYSDKTIPAKRDISGEEKGKNEDSSVSVFNAPGYAPATKLDGTATAPSTSRPAGDEIDVDKEPPKRQSSLISGHSAAQSFFGKPVKSVEEDENDTGMSEAGQDAASTSEDEESDLEDESLTALLHAKFERQKRQLEAQMVDLRQTQYRAMSPLESISRLVRISARDLERVKEMREQSNMDVDDSPIAQHQHMLPHSARSSDSADGPDLLTPKGDDDHKVSIRSSNGSVEGVRRIRRPSPEPISLPYLIKDGRHLFHDTTVFQERHKEDLESEQDTLDILEGELHNDERMQDDTEQSFVDKYRRWREECEDLDRGKEEQERLERQQSLEPGPEIDAPMAPPAPVFESRRLYKNSSEYEIEQVLKQSEETARIEQERQDRETKKNQADMEKEAIVPNQKTEDELRRGTFIDTNRHRDPEELTMVFSYDPAADNFTDNEQNIFVAAFKETPKKWGEIASLLPGRTYEDCIRHYYTKKWDGRFRDTRTKKLKAGGRRGRGGARGPRGRMGGLMADLVRPEDITSVDATSEKGRPRRAAAPTTFGEKEIESKASLMGPSPAKKPGLGGKAESIGDAGPEKPGKRQRRNGDKVGGRKAKNTQQLIAAAPLGSPAKQYMQEEDQARQKQLDDAALLASMQTGHHGILQADSQMVYTQERFLQPMAAIEDPERPKTGNQIPTTKQSASSYWSVPEQNDFVKYIGHFGRDFGAISAHMGTKTQTMIKNHYQRQIESGSRPELEQSAIDADERRARGEDVGPPPTPTPIQKRKYDSVPSNAQRPLASQGDAMDVDEGGPPPRVQLPKQASPTQYQSQRRGTSSNMHTPIQAARAAPSPLVSTVAPAQAHIAAPSQMRPSQHLLGRLTYNADTRPDPRSIVQPGFGLRTAEDPASRPPSQQAARTAAVTPDYVINLQQEQQRAMRLQQEQQQPHQPERMEQLHRQGLMRNMSQGSPLSQPLHQPERKPAIEERPPSPHRPGFTSNSFPRPSHGFSTFNSSAPSPSPFPSFTQRSPFGFSPTKREDPRPTPMSTIPPAHPPAATPTPVEPKRSNVMSLLNNDDDQQPPRRDNPAPAPAPPRTASPASQMHARSGSISNPSGSSIPGVRREPSFGQTSLPGRVPFGQPIAAPASGPPTPKIEPNPGNGPLSQTPKPDWTSRFLGQGSGHSAGTPAMDRDGRTYFQHNHRSSLLGSLGQPRANPSPPPLLSGIGHARTPSLTGQPNQQAHDQARANMLGQQQSQQEARSLQTNPYGGQQMPPYSQPPSSQAQNHAHHAHNGSVGGSMGGPFPIPHHRTMSRDEQFRQEQQYMASQQRDREEMRRRQQDMTERRHEEDQHHFAQQQRQQEQERQQGLHQQRPQPLQPPHFGGGPLMQNRSLDLRRQSQMEGEMAMREEQERLQRDQDLRRRQQEAMMQREREEDYRRRHDDSMFRRTPQGGGFGAPPPPQRR